MSKAYNHRIVSGILCYTIEEICNLFKDKKLHPQTVRFWINDGLPVCCNGSPKLIHGADLIDFLKDRNTNRRIKMEFGEFFCMSCKLPHVPLGRQIAIEQQDKTIKAMGICPATKTKMYKTYKMDDYGRLSLFFSLGLDTRLNGILALPCDTHSGNNARKPESDSVKSHIQMELSL